jgi:DNA-binding NtrC family response regulator
MIPMLDAHIATDSEHAAPVSLLRALPAPGRGKPLAGLGPLRGTSAVMQELYSKIARVAPTDATVLLTGESGTGKELVARAIHGLSARRDRSFVAVNCGAIPSELVEAQLFGHERGSFTGAVQRHIGYFESATRGTVLLDEITEMPLDKQMKLLRVLEAGAFHRVGGEDEIKVNLRIIAATNRIPEQEAREGRFREDLLYRLNVFPIAVPPLRDRGRDIALLAEHFLLELNQRGGTRKALSRSSLEKINAYAWPGNVRELRNAIQRAYILAEDVLELELRGPTPAHPAPSRNDGYVHIAVGTTLADAQREVIMSTLARYDGNKRRTARILGISLKTLYNRLEVYAAHARTA